MRTLVYQSKSGLFRLFVVFKNDSNAIVVQISDFESKRLVYEVRNIFLIEHLYERENYENKHTKRTKNEC